MVITKYSWELLLKGGACSTQVKMVFVSHLAGSASLSTRIILDRQLVSDKAGGLVYRT